MIFSIFLVYSCLVLLFSVFTSDHFAHFSSEFVFLLFMSLTVLCMHHPKANSFHVKILGGEEWLHLYLKLLTETAEKRRSKISMLPGCQGNLCQTPTKTVTGWQHLQIVWVVTSIDHKLSGRQTQLRKVFKDKVLLSFFKL